VKPTMTTSIAQNPRRAWGATGLNSYSECMAGSVAKEQEPDSSEATQQRGTCLTRGAAGGMLGLA
jgi:hypothetical protein